MAKGKSSKKKGGKQRQVIQTQTTSTSGSSDDNGIDLTQSEAEQACYEAALADTQDLLNSQPRSRAQS